MLKITAEEVNYIVHQYLVESGKYSPNQFTRLQTLRIYFRAREQTERKQIQRLLDTCGHARAFSGEGAADDPHGDSH
jgi:hypothetical protein